MKILEQIIEEFDVNETTAVAILNCLDTMIDQHFSDEKIDEELLFCAYQMKKLNREDFETYTIDTLKENTEDTNIVQNMEENNAEVLLYNPPMARGWYFKNVYTMVNFFRDGGLLEISKAYTLIA